LPHAPMKGSSPRLRLGRHPQHQRLDFKAAVFRDNCGCGRDSLVELAPAVPSFASRNKGLILDRRSGRRCCVSLFEATVLRCNGRHCWSGCGVRIALEKAWPIHRPGTVPAQSPCRIWISALPARPLTVQASSAPGIILSQHIFSTPYAAAKPVAVHGSREVRQKLIIADPDECLGW